MVLYERMSWSPTGYLAGGHTEHVNCTAFSPNGRYIATAGGGLGWAVVCTLAPVREFVHMQAVDGSGCCGDRATTTCSCNMLVWAAQRCQHSGPAAYGTCKALMSHMCGCQATTARYLIVPHLSPCPPAQHHTQAWTRSCSYGR